MPFYTDSFGCREVSKPDIFLDGFAGELAFTDVHVLIYPGTAEWPEPGMAVNSRGYTGSCAPPSPLCSPLRLILASAFVSVLADRQRLNRVFCCC